MRRKPDETVHLKLRLPESLRAQLEKSAERSGRSMNSEILDRLNSSFATERAYGGEAMKGVALDMASAFFAAGTAAAAANGHGKWKAEEWLSDPNCYRTAVFGVIRALLVKFPSFDLEEILQLTDGIPLMVASLKGQIATFAANRAEEPK